MELAIIYNRKSCLNNNQTIGNNLSLENQKSQNSAYARKNKLKIEKIVNEINSAYKTCPPQLKELISELYSGYHIIINTIDRFSRSIKIGEKMLENAAKFNITIHFVTDEYKTSNDRHLYPIKQEILRAENESRLTGERIKKSIAVKRARGHYIGSAGYGMEIKYFKGIRKLVPKPNNHPEALTLSLMVCLSQPSFDLRLANDILRLIDGSGVVPFQPIEIRDDNGVYQTEGTFPRMTNRNIAKFLNMYSVFDKRGNPWKTTQITNILKRRRNISNTLEDAMESMGI